MKHFLKIVILSILIFSIVSLLPAVDYLYLPIFLIIILIYCRSNINPLEIFKKNLLILIFTAVFVLFIIISGWISGKIDIEYIISTSISIFMIFNLVYSVSLWLGKNGLLAILNRMWHYNVGLFILLLYRYINTFQRLNLHIIQQLRLRLSGIKNRKLLFARYYVPNLIYKELHAYPLNQAALYMRLNNINRIKIHEKIEKFGAGDIIILIASITITGIIILR